MLFASITEFGAVSAGYRKVLDDLAERQRRLKILLEEERVFAATLGTTDLVEVLLFDSFFPLAEVGGSGAQAFRRAIGVWCPQAGSAVLEAPPRHQPTPAGGIAEICCVQDALDEDPSRPFFGVIYAKASPIVRLCLPAEQRRGGRMLATSLLANFLDPNAQIWTEDIDWYLRHARGPVPLPNGLPRLRVAPLGGLDSVDVVFLVRASRLEQLGAVAWAVRRQTLGVAWPADENPEALRNVRSLLGDPRAASPESWDNSPMFTNTSSTLGVPIRARDRVPEDQHLIGAYPGEHKGRYWVLEGPRGNLHAAAEEMALLVRYRFLPGFFRRVGEGAAGLPGAGREGKLLQLFGQRDALAYNQRMLQHPGQMQPVGRYTVDEILRFMSALTGAEGTGNPPGLSSVTEVALVVHDPEALRLLMPGNELIDGFRDRLSAVRDFHLQRTPSDFPGPWVGTWLQGAKVAGLSYPVTNGVLNLICSVLDYLEEDLENFSDLLPPIRILVDWADAYRRQAGVDRIDDRQLTDDDISLWTWELWQPGRDRQLPNQLRSAAEIARFYESLEQLATFRGRRDHPLRAPNGTLAFEGHAGYRLARDGFTAYVKALARELEPSARDNAIDAQGRILVLDSATGRPTCQAEPGGTAVVRVSAMAVHHPMHWVFGHEIAHARFAHTRVNARPELFRAAHDLVAASGVSRKLLTETIEDLLRAVSHTLWDELAADEESPFCRAAADVLSEVPADLIEWRSLQLEGDAPGLAERRFWFVTGPGLVHGLRDNHGRAPIGDRRVRRLLLRVFFVSRFINRRAAPGSWREDLQDVCEWLFCNRDAFADARRMEPLGRMADAEMVERLRCLKEDLEIPDDHWASAMVRLVVDRSVTSREGDDDWSQFRRVQQVVDAWIPFVDALVNLGPTPAKDGARAIYAQYLDEIMALSGWENCNPWPPFIVGHPNPDAFNATDSRRRSRRRPEYNMPAVSQRGGVMMADTALRRAYHEITLHCVQRLEDLSRERRREVLASYLDQGQRGIRVSLPPR